MSDHYANINDTVYFHAGTNDEAGVGDDGTTPVAVVRECGAAADTAPITAGVSVNLLTDAGYPAGCYEIAIAVTAGNGYTTNLTYAVFFSLAVGTANPTGFVGRVHLEPVVSNVARINGSPSSAGDLRDFVDEGYDPATKQVNGVKLVDVTTTNSDMRGTDGANTVTPAVPGDLMNLTAGAIAAVQAGLALEATLTGKASQASVDAVKGDTVAIKLKTDQLIFGKANELDVNIRSVNNITVTGDGQLGTEWGPE